MSVRICRETPTVDANKLSSQSDVPLNFIATST